MNNVDQMSDCSLCSVILIYTVHKSSWVVNSKERVNGQHLLSKNYYEHKMLYSTDLKAFTYNKIKAGSNDVNIIDRGKRYWLPAFSHFPTMFSKAFLQYHQN